MWSLTFDAAGAAVLQSAATRATGPVSSSGASAGEAATGLERAAFQSFYERTARRLWAYVARASGDPSLADDLTQEAYLRFLRSGFVGEDEDHRRGYLFRIATNLLRDRRRRSWREVPAAPETVEAPPSAPAAGTATGAGGEQVSLRRDLGRLFSRLEPRQRQLLWLAHVEGASHREIAAVLEVREASVRPMLFRARQKLAGLLRAEGLVPEGAS